MAEQTTGPTKSTHYRLGEETLAQMDELAARLHLGTRTAVIRYAIMRLHESEMPKKNLEKNSTGH